MMRVGELAKATGISVSALRHYDEVGLLVPCERSDAGYRLYSPEDVQRLFRVRALRRLGFGLDQTAAVLDGEARGLGALVADQLAQVAAVELQPVGFPLGG